MKFAGIETLASGFEVPRYSSPQYAVSPDMLDRLLAWGIKREHIYVIEEQYGPWPPTKESESRRRILEGID